MAAERQTGSAWLDVGCARAVVAPRCLAVGSAGIDAAKAWAIVGEARSFVAATSFLVVTAGVVVAAAFACNAPALVDICAACIDIGAL
jgi:hypothetical protein